MISKNEKRQRSLPVLGRIIITHRGGVLVEKTAIVDLRKNGTYIVKDGRLIEIPIPQAGYGKQVINWQGGKPCTGTSEQILKF